MRLGLVVDSACDLPQDFIDDNHIVVMPITIRLNGREQVDVREPAQTRAFYGEHLATRAGASTSAPTVEQMKTLFRDQLAGSFDYVFCLTLASSRSQIHEHALRASREIGQSCKPLRDERGRTGAFAVRVIDCQSLFAAQGVLAVEAVRMIRAGESATKIRERLDYLAWNTIGYMLPRNLYYLRARAQKKGDKSVGWTSFAIGTLLDIKPLIQGWRNQTQPCARLRHFDGAAERLFAHATRRVQRGLHAQQLVISYGGDLGELDRLPGYAELRRACAEKHVDVFVSTMSVTGAINVGEGALCLAFADEPHVFS
ncbi:MAG: DegV family protein [Panacagrimonas sp.]